MEIKSINLWCCDSPPTSSDPLYSRHRCSTAPRFAQSYLFQKSERHESTNIIFTPGSSCSMSMWPAPPTWGGESSIITFICFFHFKRHLSRAADSVDDATSLALCHSHSMSETGFPGWTSHYSTSRSHHIILIFIILAFLSCCHHDHVHAP